MKKSIVILMLVMICFISGCANEAGPASSQARSGPINEDDSWADYMADVEEQSSELSDFLTNEAETQFDMNMKSKELCELWEDALNRLWSELEDSLPEGAFEKLQDEQRDWLKEKEHAVEEAGKEVEGGSLYPLIVNCEAARITEERVYELYELLKQ